VLALLITVTPCGRVNLSGWRCMFILGLVGATGAGKSALGNRLVEHNGYRRVHTGQPIKDMLASLGLSKEELHGPPATRDVPSVRLSGRSPRYAMQTLGTDWGRRMISPKIWADALDCRLKQLISEGVENIVIDDLRFPEDCAVIVRRNGVIARVVRPGISPRLRGVDHLAHHWPRSRRFLTFLGLPPLHETEYHWYGARASFDVVNDGTIKESHAALLAALVAHRAAGNA
jgi:hypothetical protein